MPRKHREIVSGLKAKGFAEERQRKHIHFVYEDLEGRTTTARTMISHDTSGSDIEDGLLAKMAKQVGLKRKDFDNLIDCPMTREQFDAAIQELENDGE